MNSHRRSNFIYYVLVIITILFWSLTFVSTKILLNYFKPIDLFVYRFTLAYLLMVLAYPRFHRPESLKTELLMLLGGITGGSLYFLGETYAIQYSTPANVALLVAAAPLCTIFLANKLLKDSEKITKRIVIGSSIAILGVALVVYNGIAMPYIDPISSLLAITAMISWGFYSIILKKIDSIHSAFYVTRKIFFWAVITILPLYFATKADLDPKVFLKPEVTVNFLLLSLFASIMAYWIWQKATLVLGAAKTNGFINMIPLFTMIESAVILGEKISIFGMSGGILILGGVIVAEVR